MWGAFVAVPLGGPMVATRSDGHDLSTAGPGLHDVWAPARHDGSAPDMRYRRHQIVTQAPAIWWIRYRTDGREVRESARSPHCANAEALLAQRERVVVTADPPPVLVAAPLTRSQTPYEQMIAKMRAGARRIEA